MTTRHSSDLVSIVVNNFNYAAFLPHAIDSALTQSHPSIEVVVVDDGSTDGSRAVIQGYGGRIKAVLKENGGMASALNAGFLASEGAVVIFLDSDDVLLSSAASVAAEALCQPAAAKAHWRLREIDSHGRETGRLVPAANPVDGDLYDALVREGPMSANGPPTSGNAWSRRFLESVLPMPEADLRKHADAYLNTLAGAFGTIHTIAEPQGFYRLHRENDYAGQPKLDQLQRNLQMYHYRCRLLSARLSGSGIEVEPAAWKKGNAHYDDLERRLLTLRTIAMLIPPGETFILVDEGASGLPPIVAGRETVRFPSAHDEPRGRPVDDSSAIDDLERMRDDGAGFVVFVRPALWWLRVYRGLRGYLDTHYECEMRTDTIVAYNLRALS